MTELLIALAGDILPGPAPDTWLGIPIPVALSMLAVAATVVGALSTALFKKFRSPADDREDKVVVLDASDRLIQRFEALLKASDEKHAKEIKDLSDKVDGLEQDVKTMRRERFTLVTALTRVAAIARKYGGQAAELEIASVELPDDVRV